MLMKFIKMMMMRMVVGWKFDAERQRSTKLMMYLMVVILLKEKKNPKYPLVSTTILPCKFVAK